MVAIAHALLRYGTTAEDLTQEAFLAAHRNWDRISTYEDPGAWVKRVLINRTTSVRRRLGAELRAIARLGHDPDRGTIPEISPQATEVWDEVRRLPRRQQQAIVLHYVDQLAVQEVSEVMGCSSGAVKSLPRSRRAKPSGRGNSLSSCRTGG